MADINGIKFTVGSGPTIIYTITYTKSRPSNTQMKYNFSISCALGSSGSYIGSGYALLCTMTVNGASAQVRIKANDNDNWSGTTPRVKTVSVTCTSTTGNATQGVTFKVVSDGRATLNTGVITNSSYTVLSSALLITACGAPTACSLNPTLTETTSILSWSGAKAGTNNAISAYEIQYSESTNNSSWGSWITGTTVSSTATSGSYAVTASGTRGNYRRYQVRTRGTAGASYYSGWKVSTNSVRKNTAPIKPSSVTASPVAYSTESITVAWSGASGGTSVIKGYQIARRTSTNNSTWGAWTVITTLTLSATSGSYLDTAPSRTPGTYTQYGVWTIDALNVYSAETISGSIQCNITACGAPTVFSLNNTIAEGSLTLSWSGASGGAGNPIASYEIQYSESSDNTSWGSWYALTTSTSTSSSGALAVAPPSTRGYYRRFQIRTRGTAGSVYYSSWKISSNTVRKNILPLPPTAFTVSPAVYVEPQVFLNWSGAVQGTSAIKNYVIQQSTSTNGSSWGSWETVTTVATSLTYGSYTATPSNVAGMYTRYRIAVTDALNALSSYVTSTAIQKNRPPLAPIISAPQNTSITYNQKPMVLIQTQPDPDGHQQTIYVLTADGNWMNSADNPEFFSRSGAATQGIRTIFTNPEISVGKVSITVECHDQYSAGASVTQTFMVAPSPFEDILANQTHVKASHMVNPRTAVNNVRYYYGLQNYAWAQEIISGRTQIRDWPVHILELRAALQGVVDLLRDFDDDTALEYLDFTWIPLETGRPRADVMRQIQDLILHL